MWIGLSPLSSSLIMAVEMRINHGTEIPSILVEKEVYGEHRILK